MLQKNKVHDQRRGKGECDRAIRTEKAKERKKILKGYMARNGCWIGSCEPKGISTRGQEWWGRRVGGRQGLLRRGRTKEGEEETRIIEEQDKSTQDGEKRMHEEEQGCGGVGAGEKDR